MEIKNIQGSEPRGFLAPLHFEIFRRIWFASVLSNLGQLVQGVGAAWAMTELTHRATDAAMVQTALMLPILLLALPAGAMADMFDRRHVCIAALIVTFAGAIGLVAVAFMGFLTPPLILLFCFVTGIGMSLFGPAWQASVAEQVPSAILPSAVTLNSMSYNIARSLGPALGGMVIAVAGTSAAFVANALFVLPLLAVLLLWRRVAEPPRLPPENFARAVTSGLRYISHSPNIRVVLQRTLLTATAGGSLTALIPIVARDLLNGDAAVYGFMLGAFGGGAVIGAMNMHRLRRFSTEVTLRATAIIFGLAEIAVAASQSEWLTAGALLCAGACWMVMAALLNVSIQLSAPRWVAGRTLASFQAAISGGIAFGSWIWGRAADLTGVSPALYVAAATMLMMPVLGLWLSVPEAGPESERLPYDPSEIAPNMDLTPRSGPIIVEIEYRVPSADSRGFYGVMLEVQHTRHRSGAYGWSLARDIADPDLWTERYHCPTWFDYLRQRSRNTQADHELHVRASAFQKSGEPLRIRRMLERPYGSVRWREEVKDPSGVSVLPLSSS